MPEDAPGNPGVLPGGADDDFAGEPAEDEPVMLGRVRGMQVRLHRWAGEDSSRRFGDLFNLVCDPDFLAEAWMRVRKNKGSRTPGTDGVTIAAVEAGDGGVSGFLAGIRDQLKAGTYRPQPVRQVMIPKKNGSAP
jgi:RNA-directed DNA polymerase